MAEIDGKTSEKSSGNTEKAEDNSEKNSGKMAANNTGQGERISEKMVSSHTDSRPQQGRITHQPNGKFAPGNGLGGRKKRAEEDALLAVLEKALPAEDIPGHIAQCIEWAYEYKSPKLLMQIIEFKYDRLIGTPVQRSLRASGKIESILNRLSAMDEGEFDAVERAIRIPVDTENE